MGTFLKYLIYVVLLVVLYVVIKGFYDGNINSSTTLGNVANQVEMETQEIATETSKAVEKAVK